VFIFQFCNVAEVVIINKMNEEKKGHPSILFALPYWKIVQKSDNFHKNISDI